MGTKYRKFSRSNLQLLAVLTLSLISATLHAGELEGFVYDKTSGEVLIGANVLVSGTTIGTITDMQGHYVLHHDAEGKVTIQVSYIGYADDLQEVDFSASDHVVKDFYLAYGSQELEEVVVTVQAKGQIRAINEQLNSNTISNIVSAERIQEVPDANAAEAVGRLPGVSLDRSNGEGNKIVIRGLEPKFNMITINGIRAPSSNQYDNSVGLGGVSQYMLDGIEVQKALTPDKEGDVLGGIVDLKLKDAPKGFRANVIFENVFNTLARKQFNPKLTVQGSNRFFKDKLGIYAQLNYENIDRTNERLNSAYFVTGEEEEGTRNLLVDNASFSSNELTRQRYGGSINVDYQLKGGKILFSSFINGLTNDVYDRAENYDAAGFEVTNVNHSYKSQGISTVNSLTYKQQLFLNSELDVGLSYNTAKTNRPDDNTMIVGFANSTWDKLEISNPYELDNLVHNVDSNAYIQQLETRSEEFLQTEATVQANWKFPFSISDQINGYIKVGGMYRSKKRNVDVTTRRAHLVEGNFLVVRDAIPAQNPDLDFSDRVQANLPANPLMDPTYSKSILNDQFHLNSFLQQGLMNQVFNNLNASNWVDNIPSLDEVYDYKDDYSGNEQYGAGYLMASVDLWKFLTLVGGARYESMQTAYEGWGIKDRAQGVFDSEALSAERQNSFLLPMINAKINPVKWADLRLSYTHSIARPNYYDVLPRYYLSHHKDLYDVGNYDLVPALSRNLDAYLSFHSTKLGLLTIGVFQKDINDFVYNRSFPVTNDSIDNSYHPYDVVAERNISVKTNNPYKANVRGLEVEWQTVFWYLPKPLDGLVFNINYSRIKSETQYYAVKLEEQYYGPNWWEFDLVRIDSSVSRPMISQPRDIFNVSLGYDYKGFSIRVAYNFQGTTLTKVSSTPEKDHYKQNYQRLDLSVRQKLPFGLQVFVNVSNMTNTIDRSYQFSESSNPTNEEYYGIQTIVGLRYTFEQL